MQNKGKKKSALKPIYKPYLKGRPVSRTAAKRAWRVLGTVVITSVIGLLAAGMLSFNSVFLRAALCAVLLGAACAMMWAEGSRQGESDVSFAEIAHNRLEQGKQVENSDRDICYHPGKGFFTALLGALPLLLITLVFAVITHKQTHTLGVLPSWVSAFEGQPEVGQALAYYHDMPAATLEDILRVAVRIMLFPFINLPSSSDYQSLYVIEKLSPLLSLIAPAFYGLGYLRGPYLRALVHGNIRLNRRRQNRQQRKAREARAGRNQPKELI